MTSPTTDRRQGLVGNIAMKAPVAVVATTNITQSGEQTIDGVAVLAVNAAGVPDRVLCTGMTDATKNGLWDVSTAAWTRSKDANGNYDLGQGSTVLVNNGTTYSGSYWRLTTSGAITIGTTALAFALALTSSSALSSFIQSGTGAITRSSLDKMRDIVSAKDFPDVQTALNTGVSTVYLDSANHAVTTTLAPASGQTLQGVAYPWGAASTLTAAASLNVPIVKFTSGGRLKDLGIIGSATGLTTGQYGVHINGTNDVILDAVFIKDAYDLVYIDGTSFYTSILNCNFYSAVHSQLTVNSATASGVDLILRGNRFLSLASTASYSAYFNGLGSLIASDNQFTVNGGSGATAYFDLPATNYGGMQWTNTVFENGGPTTAPAVYLKGAPATPWTAADFTACTITGGLGVAIRADYANGIKVTGGTLSSTNALGAFYVPAFGACINYLFTGVDFEGNAGVSPVQCGGPVTVSGSLIGCKWTGSAALVDYTAASAGNVAYLNVLGGNPGTNATPIKLTSPATVAGTILVDRTWTTYTPTLAASVGTITTSAVTGFYNKVGRTVHFTIAIIITTNGTGSTTMTATLPVVSAASPVVGYGRAVAVNIKGLTANAGVGVSTLTIANAVDGSYPGADGVTLWVSGTYQTAA